MKVRFIDEQIISMVKEQGLSVQQLIQRINCSEKRREDRKRMSAARDQFGNVL